jgi:hypothetical protein
MSTQYPATKPQNAFYQNLAMIERRQEGLAARVEAIGASMPAPAAIEGAIAGLAAPLGQLGETISTSGADQAGAINRNAAASENAAHALARLAHAHQRLVRLVEIEREPEQRASTSQLFLGVNVDGSFTRNSGLGEMLIAASADAAGLAMDPPPRKKRVTRAEFVENGLRHAASNGFATLTPEDFGEFFDQAPHVLKAIQLHTPPPFQPGDAD